MQIYALLVGNNDYAPSVGQLRGAVNDANYYGEFLRDRFPTDQLHVESLIGSQATRENIVRAFRDLLCRAGKDDVALFQYAGHGARWKSAPEFATFYPDGFDEGLICYDSRRSSDAWDLADKELAVLLGEVARNDPHIAVILDCCHSGSGTRSADDVLQLKSRSSHTIQSARPLESYIDGWYSDRQQAGESLIPPGSRHILLAGCDRYTQAFESPETHRGIFSTTLLEALDRAAMDISYADLFLRVRSLVRKAAFGQVPQFETSQGFNAWQGFLNRSGVTRGRRFSVHYVDWNGWYVNCGALNGISTDADSTIELNLFDDETSEEVLGTAISTAVGLNETVLEIDGFQASKRKVYTAEITSVPKPKMEVFLEGDAAAIQSLLETTEQSNVVAASFQWEQEVPDQLKYRVVAEPDGYRVCFGNSGKLIQKVNGSGEPACEYVIQLLNRIANWEFSLHLQNPDPGIDTSVVDFCYSQELEGRQRIDHVDEEVTFDIVKRNGKWSEVSGQIMGQNKSDQRLYLTLVWFDEQFGITVLANEPHEANEERFVFQLNVADGVYEDMSLCLDEAEGNQAAHVLKLIVSKDEIDDFLIGQQPIEMGATVTPRGAGQSRGAKFRKKVREVTWFTKQIRLNLVRQVAEIGEQEAELANGQIRVKPHPGLQAGAALLPATQVSRGERDGFAEGLARCGLHPVNFSSADGADQSILELNHICGAESLASNPLELEIDLPLADNEFLVPLVFDGQHLTLAGDVCKDELGKTRIAIHEVPAESSGSRSAGSALKMYFFKTVLGLSNVNSLTGYEIQADGTVSSIRTGLGEKVHAASNILLLTHGWLGDSRTIAQAVADIVSDFDDGQWPFDLVLGYDFDSISTSIEDTARELKRLLKSKGVDESADKQITMLTHSVGGLVGRWLIEQEGGDQIIDQLVMCGTPNEGMPIGSFGEALGLVNRIANLALEFIPAFFSNFVSSLQETIQKRALTKMLSQTAANSEFMLQLNDSPDPGIPYLVFAGNLEEYLSQCEDPGTHSLMVKLGASGFNQKLFRDEPNDMLVTVGSMRAILDTRSPAPERTNLACHHLNYLTGAAGQTCLSRVAEIASQGVAPE